jgi:hypothetical protein
LITEFTKWSRCWLLVEKWVVDTLLMATMEWTIFCCDSCCRLRERVAWACSNCCWTIGIGRTCGAGGICAEVALGRGMVAGRGAEAGLGSTGRFFSSHFALAVAHCCWSPFHVRWTYIQPALFSATLGGAAVGMFCLGFVTVCGLGGPALLKISASCSGAV